MKKLISLLLFLFLGGSVFAQNDFNKTDKQGRRQGKWVDYYCNGNIRYVGEFKDNEPSGEFLHYSEDGVLIAKGKYNGKMKHGRWDFYSDKTGSLVLVENYDNGVVVGKTAAYSPNSNNIVEETDYVNGVKQGVYKKYYDNGSLMVNAVYENDKLNGKYISYYHNGAMREEGLYKEGVKVGEWRTYDLEGNVISVDSYGVITNQ